MEAKLEKSSVNKLQEICQRWKLPIPFYREAEGSFQEFGTEVTINFDGPVGFHALGRTKKASKSAVADKALAYVTENHPEFLELPPLPVSLQILRQLLLIFFFFFFLQSLTFVGTGFDCI